MQICHCIHQFQHTLPHGERLDAMTDTPAPIVVSTHAPAWGATVCQTQDCKHL